MTDEVLPYEATVEGVRNRVREVARPAGSAPVGGAARDERISEAVIAEWLLEAGAKVGRKLRLIDTLGPADSPLRAEYRLAARGLVELYGAALLWDATFPQAAKGERYGAVLYERYEKGLTELAGDLAVDHAAQEVAVVDGDASDLTDEMGGTGASARFPVRDPRISRYAPW